MNVCTTHRKTQVASAPRSQTNKNVLNSRLNCSKYMSGWLSPSADGQTVSESWSSDRETSVKHRGANGDGEIQMGRGQSPHLRAAIFFSKF